MSQQAAYLLQQLVNVVQLASFYLPLALAFAIMQATTRRIFLGLGEVAMFGSFAAIYVCFAGLLRGEDDIVSALEALGMAIGSGAALGYVIARLALGKNLLQSPLAFMIASIGFAIAMSEGMRVVTGAKDIWVPPLFSGEVAAEIGDVRISAMAGLGMAIGSGAALGYVIARLALGKNLLQSPLAFMIASIGFAIAMSEGMRVVTGAKDIWVPPLFSGEVAAEIGDVRISAMAGLGMAVGVASVALAGAILKWTRFGLVWRACCQSLKLASLTGIDADAVSRLAFALAGGLAGVTGWTSAIVYGGANFSVGMMIGFKAMFASVIGGFGTLRGAVAGGVALALIEVSWSAFFSTAYRDVAVFAIMVVALIIRPEGLFGMQGTRESEE